MLTDPIVVKLKNTKLSLRFDGKARYRLQSIGSNTDLTELSHPKKGFVTLVNWIWACSVNSQIEKAEDLANLIELEEVGTLAESLFKCVQEALAPDEEKKA
jgi:hypothetical protein